MTDDNAEREKRKQFLKDQLRTRRIFHQHLESVRGAEWLADPQLRWEAEQELEQEEADAAAKARQQESAAPLENAPADGEAIIDAVRAVYSMHSKGEGPNLKDIVKPVLEILKTKGLKASERRIQDAAENPEFNEARRQPGKRRN